MGVYTTLDRSLWQGAAGAKTESRPPAPYLPGGTAALCLPGRLRDGLRLPPVQAAPRLFVRFDGAAHQAVVRVNGRVAGQHRGGYTGFAVEITDLVDREGENLLTVQLDTREDPAIPPFGFVIDYLTYGGLYREVWLEAAAESRLTDLFVYTPTLHDAVVQWTAELAPAAVAVRTRLETADGTLLAEQTAQAAETGKMQLSVPDAQPWDTAHPVLHHAVAELLNAAGQPIDRKQVTFGAALHRRAHQPLPPKPIFSG